MQAAFAEHFNASASFQRADAGDTKATLFDIGGYYESERWHIEGEYLRKSYRHAEFPAVNALDAFVAYRLPLRKRFSALSLLGRYDFMSDHSSGIRDENGLLSADEEQRHRLTGGVTLSLGTSRLQADIRINYEQYFYNPDAHPVISERNKVVIEFVCHF